MEANTNKTRSGSSNIINSFTMFPIVHYYVICARDRERVGGNSNEINIVTRFPTKFTTRWKKNTRGSMVP